MKRYLHLILLSLFLSVTPAPAQAGWCDWFSWWPGCSDSATSQLQITQQPQDKTVAVGDTATLAVKTQGGTGTIHYQWYENDVLIAGATEDRYTILSAMLLQNGHWFTCKVTDNSGKWISTDKATMTVLPPTTITPTATPTESPSPTWIPTPSPTSTPTVTATQTPSVTPTLTPSPTASPTSSPTATPTPSVTLTPTATPSQSPSVTPTASPTATATPSGTPITGNKIKYWTNEKGTALYVTPFYPPGYSATQHYVQIGVLHPGGYKAGSAGPAAVAIDLAAAGFVAYAVEYPLACLQNINGTWSGCEGSMPAQVATQDTGNYPEQTDAVAQFMKWCRKQPIHNGEVDLVGGSAGASHAAYMAATGTPGDTMPNKIVMCSIGVFYLADPNLLSLVCTDNETCPVTATMNYVGASLEDQNMRNYTPYLPQLTAASPRTHAHYPGMSQMLLLTGTKDSTGIPTSDGYNIHAWDKTKNVAGVLENGSNGALPYLKSLGYQVIPWDAPQTPNTLSEMLVTTTDHAHAFEFWKLPDSNPAMVGQNVVIPWLKAKVVSSSPTPTPSATSSATPTPTSSPTPMPTTSPSPSPLAAKWRIHGCGALKAGDEHLIATDPNLKNSQIKYHRLRLSASSYWPTETSKLDFSNVVADAKLAALYGQAISVSFGFGPQSPDWMKAKCALLTNDEGATFPKPWDNNFKGYVSTFVKEAGKQLNSVPNIWQVFITGLQGKNAELRLNTTAPLSASDATAYSDVGKYIIDTFATSFPDTAVMLTEAASAYVGDKDAAYAFALGDYGSVKYPHHFGNSYSAWKATSAPSGVLSLIAKYAGKNPASVQQVMPSSDPRYEGTFEQSVAQFKEVPANAFEIYKLDLPKVTQATNDALSSSY